MRTKTCTRCKKELPATTEHFHRNRRTTDGLNWSCKPCRKKEYDEYQKRKKLGKVRSLKYPDKRDAITLNKARDRFKKKYKVGQHIKLRRKIAPGRPQPISGWISDMYNNVVIVNTGQYKEAFTYVDMIIGDVEVRG